MEAEKLQRKIFSATKWSTITEVLAKLIVPLTNIILARILTPEAFGIIATITMITSFVEMFTDSGFQKYLVHKEFKTEEEKKKSANVSFWTNMGLSLLIWALIVIFSAEIARAVGNPGLGFVIAIACVQLPLTSFSSTQLALYRRDFDFRTLFGIRIFAILIPFVITIPLALLGYGYWSLVIGTISMHVSNAFLLTFKSKWKPKFSYDINTLKEMMSFSLWSLIEAFSIWLTAWVDAFVIGYYLNEYYLGIYKTSTIMVNSLLALITATIAPILFSTLSRLQNNENEFKSMFFKFQKYIAMLVLPIGVGVFIYRDLAADLLLGSQWEDAGGVIGLWALSSSIMIVFGHFCSEVYRSKGMPKLSFNAQVLHLIFLVPTCIISAKYGFWPLVFARSLIRLQFVAVHLMIMEIIMKISVYKTFKNIFPSLIAVTLMGGFGFYLTTLSNNIFWSVISIILCVFVYFGVLLLFSSVRKELVSIRSNIIEKKF
ncbi:lipopolysaccharide biosynthesis protein [Halobacillus sp. B29]|uniref:lipopolysaccharide biosynthesis protein n=1 Tax=Halobacillus sp. B29 TaxID=3457432 RepID=UPI003FCE1EE4